MNIHTFKRKVEWYSLNLDKTNVEYYLDYHVSQFKIGEFHDYYHDLAETVYALAVVMLELKDYEYRWANVFLVPESIDQIVSEYESLDKNHGDLLWWSNRLRWKVNEKVNQTLACRISQVVMAELEKVYGKKWGVQIEFSTNFQSGDTISIVSNEDVMSLSERNLGSGKFTSIKIDGQVYTVDGSFSYHGGGFKTVMADGSVIDNTYLTNYSIGFVIGSQISIKKYLPQTCKHDKNLYGLIDYEIESLGICGKGVLSQHPYGLPNFYSYEIQNIIED